ncbi:MAG: hypothetical protein JXQ73_25455 [Phycisphaerae bacterium]|nr:hypothetical protein [Phycisphaerae bacterium]
MRRNDVGRARKSIVKWYLAVGLATFAVAGCNPPLPDNSPQATGDPVVASEVVGHWFKLVAEGDPVIDVRPVVVQGIVNALADELTAQIPDFGASHPLYIRVAERLDAAAVANVPAGTFVAYELPASQQVAPVEQADGSLLFEGANLLGVLQKGMASARTSGEEEPTDWMDGFEIQGVPVTDLSVRLWLYRMSGSEQILCRLCISGSIEVPMVGKVEVQVTVDGKAYVSEGPVADGLTGTFEDADGWDDEDPCDNEDPNCDNEDSNCDNDDPGWDDSKFWENDAWWIAFNAWRYDHWWEDGFWADKPDAWERYELWRDDMWWKMFAQQCSADEWWSLYEEWLHEEWWEPGFWQEYPEHAERFEMWRDVEWWESE